MYKNGDGCPICGIGILTKRTVDEIFTYKGETLTISDYVIYECRECEEAIVDPKTIKKTEKPIRDFQRRIDGLLTSDEIKTIREGLGYTQENFGKILGGGRKGFAKYENGQVTQSRAMDSLLRVIREYPEALGVLDKSEEYIRLEKRDEKILFTPMSIPLSVEESFKESPGSKPKIQPPIRITA